MPGLLHLGADLALTRYPSVGAICVDLRSVDALPYIFGLDIESDVAPVFRALLRPDSVVLDIGANFGFYTALAARVLDRRGRLFAFEGNPETFRCLVRTIAANAIWPDLRVDAANILVSDRNGRGTLNYQREALGGSTMAEILPGWGECRSVDVDMTTIDDFLPNDLSVDLVKLDVEGHEPMVVRGMERTLARSPKARLIVELYGQSAVHGVPQDGFIDHLRGLGFALCRILPTIGLELVRPGDELPSACYCLATRTPEEDIALVARRCGTAWAKMHRRINRHVRSWRRRRLCR